MDRRSFLKLSTVLPKTVQQITQDCQLECSELDAGAKYLVIIRPSEGDTFPDDWRWRRVIRDEIRDGFEAAGIEPSDVGVLFLGRFDVEIVEVK